MRSCDREHHPPTSNPPTPSIAQSVDMSSSFHHLQLVCLRLQYDQYCHQVKAAGRLCTSRCHRNSKLCQNTHSDQPLSKRQHSCYLKCVVNFHMVIPIWIWGSRYGNVDHRFHMGIENIMIPISIWGSCVPVST